jgi:hypothetical protein
MKRLMVVMLVLTGFSGAVAAATVTNGDSDAVLLKVTEGSQQTELAVGAGETVEFCASGCFVTMPNGDREALSGTEKVTISGGKATVN